VFALPRTQRASVDTVSRHVDAPAVVCADWTQFADPRTYNTHTHIHTPPARIIRQPSSRRLHSQSNSLGNNHNNEQWKHRPPATIDSRHALTNGGAGQSRFVSASINYRYLLLLRSKILLAISKPIARATRVKGQNILQRETLSFSSSQFGYYIPSAAAPRMI
jgi:hypothetical protein